MSELVASFSERSMYPAVLEIDEITAAAAAAAEATRPNSKLLEIKQNQERKITNFFLHFCYKNC